MLKHWLAKIGAVFGVLGCLSSFSPVQANGELKDTVLAVYMYPIGSPSAFFKQDMNELYGLDVDIIYALQKRLGFEIKDNRIYPIDYTHGLEMLENGEIDILGGGLSYSKDRASRFATTPIYLQSTLGVVYSTVHSKRLNSLQDLKNLRVFADPDSAYAEYIKQFNGEVIPMKSLTYALFMVAQGLADCVLYDRLPIEDFALNVPEASLALIDIEFGLEQSRYTFYMPKNSPHKEIIYKTMQEIIDDGTISRLIKKWHVTEVK